MGQGFPSSSGSNQDSQLYYYSGVDDPVPGLTDLASIHSEKAWSPGGSHEFCKTSGRPCNI